MERLTISNSDGSVSQPMDLRWDDALKRLAAYEDTGLTPERVETVKTALMGKCLAEIKEINGLPVERMIQLAEAEHDGRLLALPCNVGDPVYYLTGNPTLASGYHFNRVESTKCIGFYFDEKGLQICLYMPHGNHGTYGYFGKTIFLTREEAEKALAKEKNDE